MSASIVLHRFGGSPVVNQHAWPLKITATAAGGLVSQIFVYAVGQEVDPVSGDRFECVASVSQLFELPLTAPAPVDATTQIPYYRRDTVEFVCRSSDEADALWTKIQGQVLDLVRNWNARLNLLEVATVSITDAGIEDV